MTVETALYIEINRLPDNLKAEALELIKNFAKEKGVEPQGQHPERKAGSRPGAYVMAPDFDDPLEDFAEYM